MVSSPTKSLSSSAPNSDTPGASSDQTGKESAFTPEELQSAARHFSHCPPVVAGVAGDGGGFCGSDAPRAKAAILPVPGRRNVLITSALPYVNNVPHLGNIVGCVLSADVHARFSRMRGYNTLYVCGTDEYGTQTETKALEEGLTPKEICDKYHALHDEVYRWFEISFDKFGRTTTEEQTKVAQDIFWDLHKEGNLLEDTMDQLYCVKCQKFLADRFVEGTCPMCGFDDARGDQCDSCGKLINAPDLIKPRCKICSSAPEIRTSRHIFINLPKIEPVLDAWLEKSSQEWTSNARIIAKSWLKGGLQPRCITRDLKWGTPVPMKGYEDKVFYVWFDAPIGYISITACYTKEWEKWWLDPDNVEYFEFMAKDNVPFHSVVFPATQLGTGRRWTMVNHLMAVEYLNYEDAKFSKSRGIGVFGNDAQDTKITSDVWRFYLMYMRPENQDSAFQWDDLMLKNNSELLGNLGNFVNRALKFCKDNFDGTITAMKLSTDDLQFLAQTSRHVSQFIDLMEATRQRESISQILCISRLGNQLMQSNKPWKLVKSADEEERRRAGSVVSLAVNTAALLTILVEPFMPGMARELRKQLNFDGVRHPPLDNKFACLLKPGHKIGNPEPLVREIQPEEVKELKQRFAGKQNERASAEEKSASTKKTASTGPVPAATEAPNAERAKVLEGEVAAQGDLVRQLKEAKGDKNAIKAEVDKLLELKKQLLIAQGGVSPAASAATPIKQEKAAATSSGKKGKKK